MKYIVITLLFCTTGISTFCQDTTGTATLKLRDSILTKKANYIGQPLSKLINDLKGNVGFSYPIGGEILSVGKGYYLNITLYLNNVTIGFNITLGNKVWVDLAKYHSTPTALWNNEMIGLLGSQIVTTLTKP